MNRLSRPLGCRSGLAVLAMTFLVPGATRAQEAQPNPGKPVIVFRVEGVKTDVADTTKASPELQQLLAEIAKKNAELHILESRLKEAQERVKKPEQPRAETPEPGGRIQLRFDGAPGKPGGIVVMERGQSGTGAAPRTGTTYELVQGEKGTLILRPVTPPTPRVVKQAPGLPPGASVPASPYTLRRDGDPRGADLEKRLDALGRELEELRRSIKEGPAPGRKAAPTPEPNPVPRAPKQDEGSRGRVDQEKAELERAVSELRKVLEAEKAGRDAQKR